LTVPSIETEEILPIGTIDLTIEAPERAPVGRLVKFRVNSRNTLREAIEDVRVVCELQSGLEFPGFDTTELTAATPRLEAGESKQWELSLQSIRGGSLCCVFRLFHGGAGESAVIERKICIEFVEQQFAIEVIGPERRVEGGRAEYVLVIGNPSQERRERVRVQMSYDKALVLRESTEDVENGAAGLIWNLGGLDPGETRQLQAEFECQTAARRACIAVEVAADGLTPDRTEACLEIAPPGNVLDIQLSDRVEPIGVGRRGQYDMSVRNIGVNDARNVRIELQIPQEVELLSATLTIRGAAVDGQYTLRDGRLVFDTIERFRRDETIEGVIEIEAKQAGRVEMKASVTSSSEPTPATTAEPTLIEAPIGR